MDILIFGIFGYVGILIYVVYLVYWYVWSGHRPFFCQHDLCIYAGMTLARCHGFDFGKHVFFERWLNGQKPQPTCTGLARASGTEMPRASGTEMHRLARVSGTEMHRYTGTDRRAPPVAGLVGRKASQPNGMWPKR